MVTMVTQDGLGLFSFGLESLGCDKCLNFNVESWNFKYRRIFKFCFEISKKFENFKIVENLKILKIQNFKIFLQNSEFFSNFYF
jgi:hypothetical protein